MQGKFTVSYFFILAFPFLGFASRLHKSGDVEIWQHNYISKTITENFSALTTTEVRFGDSAAKFYYAYLQQQFVYQPTPYFSVAPGYRQVVRRHPDHLSRWVLEYVPILDVFFQGSWKGWDLIDRNRLEYVIVKHLHYPWLYRNRLSLFFPFSWTKIQVRPFCSTEIFWYEAGGIAQVRSMFGFSSRYNAWASSEIYYMFRFEDSTPAWIYQNVFGFSLTFGF